MTLHQALLIIQIIIAALLTLAILFQNQGSSSGAMWGGSSQSYHTRRGFEKVLHYFTYLAIVLFVVVGVLILRTT